MTTIWFKPHGASGALSVDVNMAFAATVWDDLEKQFSMVSARP